MGAGLGLDDGLVVVLQGVDAGIGDPDLPVRVVEQSLDGPHSADSRDDVGGWSGWWRGVRERGMVKRRCMHASVRVPSLPLSTRARGGRWAVVHVTCGFCH